MGKERKTIHESTLWTIEEPNCSQHHDDAPHDLQHQQHHPAATKKRLAKTRCSSPSSIQQDEESQYTVVYDYVRLTACAVCSLQVKWLSDSLPACKASDVFVLCTRDFSSACELVQIALNLSHPSFFSLSTLHTSRHTADLHCFGRFFWANSAHPSTRYPMFFFEGHDPPLMPTVYDTSMNTAMSV